MRILPFILFSIMALFSVQAYANSNNLVLKQNINNEEHNNLFLDHNKLFLNIPELDSININNTIEDSEWTMVNDDFVGIETFISTLKDNLIQVAKTYLGTPYRWGGTTRKGIDCSAFIQNVFKSNNVTLPRTSYIQAGIGDKVNKSALKVGDLIFFSHSPKSRISHVAMVERISEKGEIFFIHSASSKGVSIASLNKSSYWSKRYRYGKRVLVDNTVENLYKSTLLTLAKI